RRGHPHVPARRRLGKQLGDGVVGGELDLDLGGGGVRLLIGHGERQLGRRSLGRGVGRHPDVGEGGGGEHEQRGGSRADDGGPGQDTSPPWSWRRRRRRYTPRRSAIPWHEPILPPCPAGPYGQALTVIPFRYGAVPRSSLRARRSSTASG